MSMTLYQLSDQYRRIFEELSLLEDIPQDAINDTLEGLEGELMLKMQNVSSFLLNLDAEAEMVSLAATRMQTRADALKRRSTAFRQYLLYNMELSGITEIKCDEFQLQLVNNPESVEVTDETKVPQIYFSAKMVKSLDKKAIKQSLQEGEEVPGCRLKKTKRLKIT